MLCAFFSLTADAAFYKWLDDQGETHYGEVVPPEYAGKDKVELDAKGRVIKEKPAEVSKNNPIEQTAEQKVLAEQRRKDKSLRNIYSNEKEIDLARDRNLQQIEAHIQSIHELQRSAQQSLDSYHKEANGLAAGTPIPASLQVDISAAEKKLEKLKQDLDAANAKAASVRASFEADKVRYRELTEGTKR